VEEEGGERDAPAVRRRELGRLDRLGDGADLVDLEEETVAGLLLDGAANERGREGEGESGSRLRRG